MTWKEFKEEVERVGVKDNMSIEYIDISDGSMYDDKLTIHIDTDNSFTVSP